MTSNIVQVQNQSSGISFNYEEIQLLKKSILDDKTTDAELALFSKVCQRTGLDPFARQIFGIRRDGKDSSKLTFQTSVDGYRLIADRTRCYAGSDDPLFDEGLSLYQHLQSGRKNPITATVTVWKLVQGVRCPFVASVSWDQYSQTHYDNNSKSRKLTPTWAKMPHLMLGKCAESLALRKAFPAELSGIYTSEEFPAETENFSDRTISATAAKIPPANSPTLKQFSPSAVALGDEALPPATLETKQLQVAPIPDKIQALRERLVELKWNSVQFKQCLDVSFSGRSHLAEFSDRELRDFEDFLNIFETTSLELQRLKWTVEQGKDLLLVHFGKETRSSLTFKELAELLKILQSQ
jgi:phage recombination protein Bet